MRLTRALLWLATVALAAIGVAYALVPATMLSVAAIAASPTSEFLLRMQGLALIAAAAFLVLIPPARSWRTRLALVAVAGYLIVGSVVDLRAYLDAIVGSASVPSAAVRIAAGALCLLAAVARPTGPSTSDRPASTPVADVDAAATAE